MSASHRWPKLSASELSPKLRHGEAGPLPPGRVGYGSFRDGLEVDAFGVPLGMQKHRAAVVVQTFANLPPQSPSSVRLAPPAPARVLSADEQYAIDWEANAGIQAEFPSVDAYSAYMRARQRGFTRA